MAAENIIAVVMPKWGLSMKEGRVNDWLVEEGAQIAVGDEILEVETDKIAGSVEATDAGTLRRRVAVAGEIYPVKALLAVLADAQVNAADIDAFVSAFVVPETDEEELDTGPDYRFVEVAGHRLRYTQQGEGAAPVLLIHGFGGDLDNWLFSATPLSEHHSVYALDLPGHGQSDKRIDDASLPAFTDTVVAFMDALDIDRAHLVGHSMGGGIALELAATRPQRVMSLALVASTGLGPEINDAYLDGFVNSVSRRELKPWVTELFADAALVTRQLVDDLLKYKRLDGVGAALTAILDTQFEGGVQKRLQNVELTGLALPVLIIWGREDRVIPVTHAQSVPDRCHLEILEQAGHMVQMEQAGTVNRLLLEHFATT